MAGKKYTVQGAAEVFDAAGNFLGFADPNSQSDGLLKVAQFATDASGNVTGLVGPGGVAGYVDAGLLGASPSASATANTSAIQAALMHCRYRRVR